MTEAASSTRPWEAEAHSVSGNPSGWLQIDDEALYLALVREAAFVLARSSESGLCLLVDGATAERIESLENLAGRAAWCCVAGELPPRIESAAEGLLVQAPALDKGERVFGVSAAGGSCFVHFRGAEDAPDRIDDQGVWTADRALVHEAMSALVEDSGQAAPRWPASSDPVAEQAMLMRLMGRVIELYEVRQLRALKDRNDFSAVLEILKSLSARQDAHSIMYAFVEQIAKHIGVDRCSVVRVHPDEEQATVVASHENEALQDMSINLDKYPEIRRAIELGENIVINDVTTHALLSDQREALRHAGIRAVIVVPIVLGDPEFGSLFVRALRRNVGFDPREVNFVEVVAEAGSIALERVELFAAIQRSNEELAHLAATDGLTGLYNRRYFNHRFEQEHSRATRYHLPLACLLIDIDNFKKLNDEHGHLAGDEVLRQLSERLLNSTRSHDIVARYGGEEFVAVLPQTAEVGAKVQAERLLERISSEPFRGVPEGQRVTVSIGLAIYDRDSGETPEALLQRADEALYAAKRGGKNQMVVADAPSSS